MKPSRFLTRALPVDLRGLRYCWQEDGFDGERVWKRITQRFLHNLQISNEVTCSHTLTSGTSNLQLFEPFMWVSQ